MRLAAANLSCSLLHGRASDQHQLITHVVVRLLVCLLSVQIHWPGKPLIGSMLSIACLAG